MQFPFILLTVSILLSCSDKGKPLLKEISHWGNLKDSFATKNLESFVVDSQLRANYKNFHRVDNPVIDSVINYGAFYLYSWQENDSGTTAFTTFVDNGEHGSRIIYFIFDSKNSLRSAIQVASKGGEGGIIYETRSRFLTKDTLLKISSATTQWDLSKPAPPPKLIRPKGDSTFFHLIFLQDSKVMEKKFAEKKELNLE